MGAFGSKMESLVKQHPVMFVGSLVLLGLIIWIVGGYLGGWALPWFGDKKKCEAAKSGWTCGVEHCKWDKEKKKCSFDCTKQQSEKRCDPDMCAWDAKAEKGKKCTVKT